MNKLITIALLFGLSMPLMATCNPNNNGGTCNEPGGDVGPTGPQGPAGLNGTNGKDGTDAHERVNYWRGTDVVGDFAVRLYDGKRVQVQLFDMYAFGSEPSQDVIGAGRNLMVGGRFVFKLGPDYASTLVEKQAAQIKALEARLSRLEAQ